MPINVQAAIMHAANRPLTIETVQLDGPGDHEVLIEIKATGLCHSDLLILEGKIPITADAMADRLPGAATHEPTILGHEAGAVVLECGRGVSVLKPGDHVIPLSSPECYCCRNCRSGRTNLCESYGTMQHTAQMRLDGRVVNRPWGLGTFASHAVFNEIALAKIRKDAPLDKVFYVGCGVTTGVGAAAFSAKVWPGASVIVFGTGGIGLNVLQGARLCGARQIIAMDANPERASMARRFGATEFVNPKDVGDICQHLTDLTGGGADFTFECVGNTDLMNLAVETCHPNWGVCTVVGAAPQGAMLSVNPFSLLLGRTVKGTLFGGAKGRTDVPKLVDWYMEGRIEIDSLVTHRLGLAQINEGFEMMKRGEAIRSVVIF